MLSLPHSIPLFIRESSRSGNRGVRRQWHSSGTDESHSPQSRMQAETLR